MKFPARAWYAAATVILVAAGSFASFAAQNRQQYVDVAALAVYACGSTILALVAALAAARLLKVSSATALVVAAMLLAAFFSFDVLQAATQLAGAKSATAQLLIWTAATTLAALLVASIRDPRLEFWAMVVAIVFALPPVVTLIGSGPSQRANVAPTATAEYTFRVRPNVYFFVLDGYLRPDLLPDIANADGRGFLDALRDRGFTNVPMATANYPVTWLSLGSTLSLDYIQLPESPPYTSVAAFHDIMRGRNKVVDIFRANGYRYVHVASGHVGGACTGEEDQCIAPPSTTVIDEFELALLHKTPLYVMIERFRPEWLQQTAVNTWTQIDQVHDRIVAARADRPSFVFAQFLSPHPPFLWRADCSPQPAGVAVDLEHWAPASIPKYIEAIACTNRRILRLIDAIIAEDPEAVFVLQSDHGSSFFVDWKAPLAEWTPRAIKERLSPLSTMRLPATCGGAYPTMSLVNTMRLVFSCLAGRPPNYLPDRWFVTPDSDHADFGKVLEIGSPSTPSSDGR